MKVALVYDRVNKFGGAERVLLALHKIWPDAPLYTSVYDPMGAPWASCFKVISSFVQKIPLAKKHHELYPFLMPFAFESFDFSGFDVVISVSSAEAKGIITSPSTFHLNYCLTPTRYLWNGFKHYSNNLQFGWLNPLAKLIIKPVLRKLKTWDKIASQRPDLYLAISKTVQKRIKKHYQRDSDVIYPPVNINKFIPLKEEDDEKNGKKNKPYFLTVSRLVSYKRIDLIIKAFNDLALPLKIIGDGKEKNKLKRMAKPNIEFLSKDLTDKDLIGYYQKCLAFVFAGEEDLGLVGIEAQACGKPIIAFEKGGMGETVIRGKTGILFSKQKKSDLIKAAKEFGNKRFDPKESRNNALKYNEKIFKEKFKKYVEGEWLSYQSRMSK
ncbi:glycosyltransferase family 4 protein [Candidatus Beckwithbacteria bacterium CG10_big_fil_rev_8_21_14_0_10_34_10]|uniref:Glycosyltransferase family 4 protein n=1 Tax=Candidatus Beckwithbacteria bacterium CG10_big_fil_rev_8_21_14_0_10_34_10 TaxID=1974495 RepID=A0A2H0W933_9BACT|nr:MAG: glycosyltransferase family 4 protein [Candidatus Beckwithbacteria bacterium CG10_big_fil_rev_8_21_14_0_10_34_10]